MSLRVVTWNVNSIRTRWPSVIDWARRHQPDVMLLQETKCTDAAFPFTEFAALGYDIAHHGRDHWNGVAIASRVGLVDVHPGFVGECEPPHDECRLVSATCAGIRCHSLYVPNGRTLDDPHYVFKLAWLARLGSQLAAEVRAGREVLAGGDFNVAPTDLDIYDPKRWRGKTHASPPERAALADIERAGLTDLVRAARGGPGIYTWWSYRPGQFEANRGLRIDHIYASAATAARVERITIDTDERGRARPSDHAPVVVELAALR